MFSNITNQFTSLVGAVKGGQSEEEASATTTNQSETVTTAATTAQQQQVSVAPESTTEAGVEGDESKSGWLGSAKGWLGSASIPSMPAMPSMPSMPSMPAMPSMPTIPSIPGLRKGNNESDVGAGGEGTNNVNINAPTTNMANAPATLGVEDDDKSRYISATEGADSHPASGGGTPTNEEGQIGQGKDFGIKITTKVTQQAKHFGSFLTSAISKAGTKITETVKANPILESFNKEQEAFIKGQTGSNNQGMAPWVGHPNEAKIKEEILNLSQDRRNFVRAPPAGVDFDFNYDTAYTTAVAIMAEDKALETMRFELVPKIITEENFWRNYFYRVSLIIQAAELGTLGEDGVAQASSGEDGKIRESIQFRKETTEIVKSETTLASLKFMDHNRNSSINDYESEFISDSYKNNAQESKAISKSSNVVEIIQEKINSLNVADDKQQSNSNETSLSNDEEQWEKELEAELKDYEVVAHDAGVSTKTTNAKTKNNPTRRNRADGANNDINDDANSDNVLPTLTNIRTRTTANEWEEYADLIEDTDDLK